MAGGVPAATFRRVAAEARLNIGSVRHYFADHEALIVAVATEVGDRMGRRLTRHQAPAPGDRAAAQNYLLRVAEELVPLDDERHCEAVILMEIIAAARITPTFEPVVRQMAGDLREVLIDALTALGSPDPEHRAVHLAALISGLSLDSVTPHGSVDPATIRAVLEQYVATL